MMEPCRMTASEINKELDSISKKESAVNQLFIANGRGHETAEDTWKRTDPLAVKWQKLSDRRFALLMEVERRAGPGAHRLPIKRGWFGPTCR